MLKTKKLLDESGVEFLNATEIEPRENLNVSHNTRSGARFNNLEVTPSQATTSGATTPASLSKGVKGRPLSGKRKSKSENRKDKNLK